MRCRREGRIHWQLWSPLSALALRGIRPRRTPGRRRVVALRVACVAVMRAGAVVAGADSKRVEGRAVRAHRGPRERVAAGGAGRMGSTKSRCEAESVGVVGGRVRWSRLVSSGVVECVSAVMVGEAVVGAAVAAVAARRCWRGGGGGAAAVAAAAAAAAVAIVAAVAAHRCRGRCQQVPPPDALVLGKACKAGVDGRGGRQGEGVQIAAENVGKGVGLDADAVGTLTLSRCQAVP